MPFTFVAPNGETVHVDKDGNYHHADGTPFTPEEAEAFENDTTGTDDDGSGDDGSGDDGSGDDGSGDDGSGDGTEAATDGSGVEFTPDPDAPVLPPRDSLTFDPFTPKEGAVDPADDGGVNTGQIDTTVRLPDSLTLLGNPGSANPGLDFGSGSGSGGPLGDPLAPDDRVINHGPDSDFGAGATGPEDDPFDTGPTIKPIDRDDVGAGTEEGDATNHVDLRDSTEFVIEHPVARLDGHDLHLDARRQGRRRRRRRRRGLTVRRPAPATVRSAGRAGRSRLYWERAGNATVID